MDGFFHIHNPYTQIYLELSILHTNINIYLSIYTCTCIYSMVVHFFWHKMYILWYLNPNHFSVYFLNISSASQSIASLFKNVDYTFLEEFVWKKVTEVLAWPHTEVEIQESFRSKLFLKKLP